MQRVYQMTFFPVEGYRRNNGTCLQVFLISRDKTYWDKIILKKGFTKIDFYKNAVISFCFRTQLAVFNNLNIF